MDLLNALLKSSGQGSVQSAASAGGLESLTKALSGGNHQRCLEDPRALQEQSAVTDANAMHCPKVFEANREVIRDPNKIFVGQMIRMPK
jgi:hypothetical protein